MATTIETNLMRHLITDNNSRNEQNSQVNKNTTSNKKRSVTILGDSMVKGIEGYKMKKALNNKINVYIKSFPGAIIEDMYSYAKPSLKHDPNVIYYSLWNERFARRKTSRNHSR